MLHRRRIVITGMGLVCPLGNSVQEAWPRLVAGESATGRITRFDATGLSCQVAAEVKNFQLPKQIRLKDVRRMDLFTQYGLAAAGQAIEDAAFDLDHVPPDRVGVCVGSGIGGLPGIECSHTNVLKHGYHRMSPFFVPSSIINMVAGHISICYGLVGPNYSIVSACATSAHCIGSAARAIMCGDADIMVAGGAEGAICALGISGFTAMRALSLANDQPESASRPWDVQRDGFVLSEGAAVVILESYDGARQRGANIYAELVGFAMNADASHMTKPCSDGHGQAVCMQKALADAQLHPQEIDYVNAHATSTVIGDVAEVRAIKKVFGAYAHTVPVSSSKSMLGHSLGAAGATEAIISILALREHVIPPTINLVEPAEECNLDFVPLRAKQKKLRTVLSNSFGFGGTNATLIFKGV